MNYRYQTMFLLFVLFALKEILSTQTTLLSNKHDISSSLPNWIATIFQKADAKDINDALVNAFASAEYHRVRLLEYNITRELEPFQSKIIFYDVNFYTHAIDARKTYPYTLKTWKLSDNKICLTTEKMRITLEGEVRPKKDQFYAFFFTTLHFKNFVLEAIPASNDPYNVKFSFNVSYDRYYVRHHETFEEINWPKRYLTYTQRNELTTTITPILPQLLREHIDRNPKFSETIDQIVKIVDQPSENISAYPNLQSYRNQYYYQYQIPKIPFFSFCLKNLVIEGLLNLESLKVDTDAESSIFTHTLLMKNIRGNMILDYGSKKQKPLELNYVIDYLSISIKKDSGLVHVTARSYSVNRTATSSPLSYRQSANIIQKIECAAADVLVPSKLAWKTCDIESDIGEIEITNDSDWKSIERKYSDWIPFNKAY
ncbi:uncharacterized protein LOC135837300 [Planococcus citri]|uniref:uncharacterized protein LOC135837300 n=1 Tax=Planococcus citri TaxID=170843 RepID=UPI0031F89456